MPCPPPPSRRQSAESHKHKNKKSQTCRKPKSKRPARLFLCLKSTSPNKSHWLNFLSCCQQKRNKRQKFQGKGDASTGGVARRYKLTPTSGWRKSQDTTRVHSSRTRPATGTEVSTRSREHSGLPVPCAWGGRPGDGRVICREMQVAGLGKLVCTGGSCQGWVSGRLIVLCCSVLSCAVGRRSRTDGGRYRTCLVG